MSSNQTYIRTQAVSLVILAVVAVGGALYWLEAVLVPFVLAVFISVGLMPLVNLQVDRLKLPRPVAAGTALLVALLLLAGVGLLVGMSVARLGNNAEFYQQRFQQVIDNALETLPLTKVGLGKQEVIDSFGGSTAATVRSMLTGIANAVTNILSQGGLVLIYVGFLLFGSSGARPSNRQWRDAERQTKRYIIIKTGMSAVTGVLTATILYFLRIDLAVVFGLLAFLLNYIPSLGSIIATLLPLPIVLLDPNATPLVILLAILGPGSVQFTIGNIIEPKVMGRDLDLHPITVLMALIFWGILWGPIGMILSVPITAVVKIILERHDSTRPYANILAGRLGRNHSDAAPDNQPS
ncbi:MAG: AI-2E family transporter [Planctomycetes bacterium]|jgi:AI-2 transport protein TqsA|nr:AI-2E family transporter [Phycisphaerae bacterium]NBB95288.1 AI-2E family transporter [Planctomycetota bacterium]